MFDSSVQQTPARALASSLETDDTANQKYILKPTQEKNKPLPNLFMIEIDTVHL